MCRRVSCVLCRRSEETEITGALSTKDEVTAHQNCLLFSSGIYCKDSPQFDDLFGFLADDVKEEVRRGKKLKCCRCKKNGATAGCEEVRCKKSYHYPCAVEDGAHIIESPTEERYVLYCRRHHERNSRSSMNEPSTSTSQTCSRPREATSSKIWNGGSAGPSSYFSDSSSSSAQNSSKRRLSSSDKEEETPTKRMNESRKRSSSNKFPHSDDDEPEISIFFPIDSNESANSAPFSRRITDSPTGSPSDNQLEEEEEERRRDEDETMIASDAESESLLAPVKICVESRSPPHVDVMTQTAQSIVVKCELEPLSPLREDFSPGPSTTNSSGSYRTFTPNLPSPEPSEPNRVEVSPAGTSRDAHRPPAEPTCSSPHSSSSHLAPSSSSSSSHPAPSSSSHLAPSSSSHLAPSSSHVALSMASELNLDSVSFWRSCNMAGCTQAIFSQFIHQMNNIATKIQSEQASQEDSDRALAVMEASGRLPDILSMQQEELKKKQIEFQKAAAMMDVVKGLRKNL